MEIPEGDDDELRILGPIFDIVGHDRDIAEIKCSVDLVHEIQRSGLGRRYK